MTINYFPVRNQQLTGFGNFSLFNAAIVGEQYVYPSNPPLEFGGSTAGVVDIRTRDELDQRHETDISVSFVGVGAFHTSEIGRKSFIQAYANYQFSGAYKFLNKRSLEDINNFSSEDVGVNFHSRLSKRSALNVYSYFINEKYSAEKGLYNYYGTQEADNRRNFNILNYRYSAGRHILSVNAATDVSVSNYGYGAIDDKTRSFYPPRGRASVLSASLSAPEGTMSTAATAMPADTRSSDACSTTPTGSGWEARRPLTY